MMKRQSLLLMMCLGISFLISGQPGRAAAAARSPEDVALEAVDAIKTERYEDFAKLMHPEALRKFRSTMVTLLDAASRAKKSAQVLSLFKGAKSVDDLKKRDDASLLASFLANATKVNPETKELLAKMKVQSLGHISDAKGTEHVVYRTTMPGSGRSINTIKVVSLQKNGEGWGLLLGGDIDALIVSLKQKIKGNSAFPNLNLAASKVEALGKLSEGDEKAHVVYRWTTPMGDTKVSKIDVVSLDKSDPGWQAVKTGKTEELTKLVEQQLGIRKSAPPAAKKSQTAAKKGPSAMALATAEFPDPADVPKTTPKILGRSTSKRAKAGYSRDEVDDLPASFLGGDRDRFHDVAQKGGILVGVRVSYVTRFGGRKISSVQPIYRSGEFLREGGVYGQVLGPVTTAIAKPGYAVGALKTHTGLSVDGFGMVFMKIDENHLDSSDSYNSPWLGDREGGVPKDVESDGSIPVGLQGRAGKVVNVLGLILLK